MKLTLAGLLLVPAFLLVTGHPRTALAADVSVRVLPHQYTDSETCGLGFFGRCEEAIWCDDLYAPISVPYGNALATTYCGGSFGEVFAWGNSGYGEAQAYGPLGPGGPIRVTSWVEWGDAGPAAIEFRVSDVGLYEFIDSWFIGDGDYNSDGATTPADIFDFLSVYLG